MFKEIDVIKDLALKYSKPQLGRMAQLGMIEPQKAMMAGMMRDRIAKEDAKPPTATVAQDVLGLQPPQQQQQPQQMGMPQMAQAQGQPQEAPQPQPQMGMPQSEQPPMGPEQMAATGGLTSIPIESQDYAGGGIVAFDEGGEVPRFRTGGGMPMMPDLNVQLQEYTARPVGDDFIEKDLAETQKLYAQQGVINPYEGLMKQQEAKRGELGTRKEQAKGEFLMNIGASLMGAKRGQEGDALREGTTRGLASYKDAMKDVRASEERLDDRKSAYELANYQAKKTGTDASIAKRDAARTKLDDAKNKNIEAQNALAVKGAEFEMQGYGKQMDVFSSANAARIQGQNAIATEKERQKAMPDFFKIANSPELIKDMPNTTLAQRLEAVGQYQHPKDVYNALSARQSNVVRAIADAQGPLWLQYSNPKATEEQKRAVLTQIQDVATKVKAQANWTSADEARLQQLNKQASQGTRQALPMPASAADAVKGQLYDTPQGTAIWDGTQFIAQ